MGMTTWTENYDDYKQLVVEACHLDGYDNFHLHRLSALRLTVVEACHLDGYDNKRLHVSIQ